MPWFFFGSLMDLEVLEAVLGRPIGEHELQPAHLPNYCAVRVCDESYPAAITSQGATLNGVLVHGLSEEESQRICYFESAEFDPQQKAVINANGETLHAAMFISTEDTALTSEAWSFEAWQASEMPHYLDMTKEWMSGFGVYTLEEMEVRWQANNPHAKS